jgi:hypothetical protein
MEIKIETSVEKVERILTELGIKMEIGGCGCCGSPWVKVEYKGETVINEESVFINNFDKTT